MLYLEISEISKLIVCCPNSAFVLLRYLNHCTKLNMYLKEQGVIKRSKTIFYLINIMFGIAKNSSLFDYIK